MKRGLIAWDKTDLPPEAFEARLASVRHTMAARGLHALLVYSDVWQSNLGRYFSNFMPYWNRALIVIPAVVVPAMEKPVLLCSLSPRVYPWIKTVTIFDEIKPSPNLAQRVFAMCAEKGWKKIGAMGAFPYDLDQALRAGEVAVESVNAPPPSDEWALSLYRRAAALAREGLQAELSGAAVGLPGHEFVARLEHRYRHAGAEDLVILFSNGAAPPAPASAAPLSAVFSAAVALEYRGHWVKIVRNHPGLTGPAASYRKESLSGPYPYESTDPPEQPGVIFAVRTEIQRNAARLFHGDSYVQTDSGAELL